MADDIPMDDADTQEIPYEQTMNQEFTKFVNDEIFKQLQSDDLASKYPHKEQKVVLTDSRGVQLYRKKNDEKSFAYPISWGIEQTYSVDVADADVIAASVANVVKTKYGENSVSDVILSADEMNRLKIAFKDTEYLGDANIEFEKYLWTCWGLYRKHSSKYKAPYVAVLQSSGFGKSRMLFELARKAQHSPPNSRNMKVLYVCARLNKSTGFPEVTDELRNWLFVSQSSFPTMSRRLQAIYRHAHEHRTSIQGEWMELFTDFSADLSVKNTLEKSRVALKKEYNDVKDESAPLVILVIDEARSMLALEHKGMNYFRHFRRALADANSKIKTGGGIFGVLVDTNSTISDLVPPLSLDPSSRPRDGDALTSFPPFVLTHTMDVIWRSAIAEHRMDRFDNDEVDRKKVDIPDETMVDTELSETEKMVRSLVVADHPVHNTKDRSAEIAAYKATLIGSESEAWKALMRMGRPMWERTFSGQTEHEVGEKGISDVVVFAANKLLLGVNHRDQTSYNEATMFGVASVLCRLGMRPYSRSSLASRVIADFMAILAYVDYEKEGYLSSYASDPVLTLGAMKMWYGKGDPLSKFILPQLKKLILNETLDTGGVGEMVARIVLLLAMDSCVIAGKPIDDCEFSGQFVPLEALLKVLGVDQMPVKKERMVESDPDTDAAYKDWYSQWKEWQVSFTHFVQLTLSPNEDTLWYLLGRRAAGVFPRNQKGADLLIPIFRKKKKLENSKMEWEMEASMILVQVKNKYKSDPGFSTSAADKLCPSYVFTDRKKRKKKPTTNGAQETCAVKQPEVQFVENPLSRKTCRQVIRIYMNLQEESNSHYRFIFTKQVNTEGGATPSVLGFTLCYRSLRCETFPFLTTEMVPRLTSLLKSVWNPMVLVEGDLKQRKKSEEFSTQTDGAKLLSTAMTDENLKEIASKGLVDAPGHCKHVPITSGTEGHETDTNDDQKGEDADKQLRNDKKREQEEYADDSQKYQRV